MIMARRQNEAGKLLRNNQFILQCASTPDMSRVVQFVQEAVVYDVVRHGGHHLLRRHERTRIVKVTRGRDRIRPVALV